MTLEQETTLPAPEPVDAAPFAARRGWVTPQDYEIWWEDPRDVFRVVVRFADDVTPAGRGRFALSYWQGTWPRIRLAKGALAGAGREGWLAIDDWTNGAWCEADCELLPEDGAWIYTFRPINAAEFPNEADFPATYRHTLKLRLHWESEGVAAPAIEDVQAYTDSEWRTADVRLEWADRDGEIDARLEAYNGTVLNVEPLTEGVAALEDGTFNRPPAGALCATVCYAHNEDGNSFDRTIVTCRAGEDTFSFGIDDVLAGQPIFVRDLGSLVTLAGSDVGLADCEAEWQLAERKTLHRRVAELPEQTWEAAWAGMPPKKKRIYYCLGCEGSRQKFRLDPNGDIMLGENFLRRAPGSDTPRMSFSGDELWYRFGLPEPADRSLAEGYLPIVRSLSTDGGLTYEQEAYATWMLANILGERPAGDEPTVAMVRFRITNTGSEAQTARLHMTSRVDEGEVEALSDRGGFIYTTEDGERRLRCHIADDAGGKWTSGEDGLHYEATLAGGTTATIYAKIPFLSLTQPSILVRLAALSYDAERERVAHFWRQRTGQGCQIETPNEHLNAFYRSHLMHMLVINDREPGADRNVARCGGFHYGSFPDEGVMVISDLDRRGYLKEAERCLQLYVDYQGTQPLPGNYQGQDGVFYGSGGYECNGYNRNQGWVLWGLAEHYRYSRDRAWLERVAPALIKGCDWVTRERQVTRVLDEGGRRPIQYGFLPAGSLEDVTDYWTWLPTNAYAAWGMKAAADVLAEIGHPEAERLAQDADLYRQELAAGFFEAMRRSPVVPLRDGTWVPHFPTRQERRGRDFGWLREVLEGAVHLIFCGFVDPNEPAAKWIIDDYEDNLFNGERTGYPAPDFEAQWFGWGGFSMQPNLLIYPLLFLMRDEPKHYLRTYFNPFASAFYPDVLMLTEHPLPTLADYAGDHFKTSDEANSTYWLRSMFFAEHDRELFVGQAIPREWLANGKTIRVRRALTHFGEASLEIVSHAATGVITVQLDPPGRNPPDRIHLRVRHPDRRPMRSVWINGLPWRDHDPDKEVIHLGHITGSVEVRILY